MNGIPMKFDFSKTLNEQQSTFDYYKNRYISYELELIRDRKEIERLNNKLLKIKELINRTPRQTSKERAYIMLKSEIAEVIGVDKE